MNHNKSAVHLLSDVQSGRLKAQRPVATHVWPRPVARAPRNENRFYSSNRHRTKKKRLAFSRTLENLSRIGIARRKWKCIFKEKETRRGTSRCWLIVVKLLLEQTSWVIFHEILHEALRRAEHPLPRIGYGAGARGASFSVAGGRS